MKKLPETLYAYTEQDADDEYVVAFADPKECVGLEEEKIVGMYVLDSRVKIINTTEVIEIMKE